MNKEQKLEQLEKSKENLAPTSGDWIYLFLCAAVLVILLAFSFNAAGLFFTFPKEAEDLLMYIFIFTAILTVSLFLLAITGYRHTMRSEREKYLELDHPKVKGSMIALLNFIYLLVLVSLLGANLWKGERPNVLSNLFDYLRTFN